MWKLIAETSPKKGHDYVTNVTDLESGRLLFMTPWKDAATIKAFAVQLTAFQGSPESIAEVAMGMSPAFRSGVDAHLRNAKKSV